MGFDVLALLFIAFSVISSLVRKFQERQRENQREFESRGTSHETRPTAEPALPEVDLSEWDIFQEPEAEEKPFPRSEFREVRGARPVSEADTGREFQEVRGARTVSEADSGPEFRNPLVVDGAETAETYRRVEGPGIVVEETRASAPRKRGKTKLRFNRDALVNAVLYKEILGTPRGEDMPW